MRFIIKRDRPVKESAVAKSNPTRLQLFVTTIHKASKEKSRRLKLLKMLNEVTLSSKI